MEWKKETVSAAELERRQQEYLRAAVSMMKRSHVPLRENEKNEPIQPETKAEAEKAPAEPETTVPEDTENGVEPVKEEAPSDWDTGEGDVIKPPEKPGGQKEQDISSDSGAAESDETEKYGVFTAEEIMNGEYRDEGLRKAAEILEEMTKSAEMMKKLASDSGNGDGETTDFPDFSCEGGEENAGMFREDDTQKEAEPQ